MLDAKYVFHIPICKFEGGKLEPIDIDGVLDDLIDSFAGKGFESLYITKVKSIYRGRLFDELTLTLFTSQGSFPERIFIEWFKKNNDTLQQEALAFECGNEMIIERLR